MFRKLSILSLALVAVLLSLLSPGQGAGAAAGRAYGASMGAAVLAPPLSPIGTGFTYSGLLVIGGAPAGGQYDFTLKLFDALSAGVQVGSTINIANQAVIDGHYDVQLDFGPSAFQGQARWIEIAYRQAGGGAYTTLTPRQPASVVPYALSLSPGAVISGNSGAVTQGILTVRNESVGTALYGNSTSGYGLYGSSTSGKGVYGSSISSDGVYGSTSNNLSAGVFGSSTSGTGVKGTSSASFGVYGSTSSENPSIAGVLGQSTGTGGVGVKGTANFGSGTGVYGTSSTGTGVRGEATTSSGMGVWGSAPSSGGTGVYGEGYYGIFGYSDYRTGNAIYGLSNGSSNSKAVVGDNWSGYGVYGTTYSGIGVYGQVRTYGVGYAAYFQGNVHVNGTLSKSAGSFKIDDPLDPENKYLSHSFVESPDMMNVYNGNVTTDGNGGAVVQLPDYFEALNRDFRYQLTVMGQFAQAIVSQKVKDNRFTILTDKPNVEVSWQVTGIRQDPYAVAHPIEVEVEKPKSERGTYLNPLEWGQPESKGLYYEPEQLAQQPQSATR